MRSRIVAALTLAVATGGQAQPAAPRVRITEELRLDATAEDFPSVSRVFVGPGGQIVVPISADQHLRIYDSTGKRIAVVGHRGEGPGEFTGIGLVGWLRDTLWASDSRQRRTVFMGPDYRVLRTESWPQVGPGGIDSRKFRFASPIVMLPGGATLVQAIAAPPGRRVVLGILSSGGYLQESLSMTDAEMSPDMIWISGWGFGVPFSLQPQYAFAHDGSRFTQLSAPIPDRSDGTFTVTLFQTDGDTVFTRSYPFRGATIPRRVADSVVATLGPAPGHAVNTPVDLARQVQAEARRRMSSWYIPVETILLGLDRTIWIGLRVTDEGRGYLILNDRGDPIGSLMVPASTRVRQASATRIWVTATDEDGLSSVVRYRVSGL
ncbi:MAG TPA: hypothetical protein VF981_13895 [Gemmatimonadaceae bacterium]